VSKGIRSPGAISLALRRGTHSRLRMYGEKGGRKGWEGGEVWAGARRRVCGGTEAEGEGEEEVLEEEGRGWMWTNVDVVPFPGRS